MRKIVLQALYSSILVVTFLCISASLQAQNTVIKAGHLFDSRTGKFLDDQEIIIKNGRILQTGRNLKHEKNDIIIDLSKSWVLPGLMDCHVHITSKNRVIQPRNFKKLEGGRNSSFLYFANHDPLCSKIIRHRKSRGILEKNYRADIIALKNNPIENIDAVKDVHFVMKEGEVIKKNSLSVVG